MSGTGATGRIIINHLIANVVTGDVEAERVLRLCEAELSRVLDTLYEETQKELDKRGRLLAKVRERVVPPHLKFRRTKHGFKVAVMDPNEPSVLNDDDWKFLTLIQKNCQRMVIHSDVISEALDLDRPTEEPDNIEMPRRVA